MWVVRTTEIIENAIYGLVKSINKMPILLNYGYNVSEIQSIFYSKELCNIMIIATIKQMIIGDEIGYGYSDGFELAHIREFLCKKCNKKTNYTDKKNICINCFE